MLIYSPIYSTAEKELLAHLRKNSSCTPKISIQREGSPKKGAPKGMGYLYFVLEMPPSSA